MKRARVRPWRATLLGAACVLAAPQTASAHLVTSGVGPFYDGVAHLFVSPQDLLVVLALALFGGLCGRPAAKWLVVTLPAAWLLGTWLGTRVPVDGGPAWLPAGTVLVAGLLVAASPRVPARVPSLVAAGLGLVHGFLNGRALVTTGTSLLSGVGIVTAVGLVALLLAAGTVSLRAPWQRIAVRTIGSWVGAVGLLALAWSFRASS